MYKKSVEELRKQLLGKTMSFMDLDNYMSANGYYSMSDEELEERDIVYTAKDTCMCEVQILYKIVVDNGKDESVYCFFLEVTEIKEY